MNTKMMVLLAALATGVLINPGVFASEVEQYKKALAEVQAKREEAAKSVQLWSTTGELLESARNAAEGEHFERATELIKEASLHIDLALATAEREKDTWQRNVPK